MTPLNHTQDEFPKSAPMKLSAIAGKFCASPHFRAFLTERFPARFRVDVPDAPMTVDEAADIVRFLCHVGSRASLDTDRKAARRFMDLFFHPYSDWTASRAQAHLEAS